MVIQLIGFMLLILAGVIGCKNTTQLPSDSSSSSPQKVLNIWWDKGYVLEEDEALQNAIQVWQEKTKNSVKLSFYTADEITQKAQRAYQAGQPPDVLFSSRAEYPLLAWNGQLADVSDVIEANKNLYSSAVLEAAFLSNKVDKNKSYYAVPLHQATIHIFYWRDLLKEAGFDSSQIPKDWDKFWQFWQTAQNTLRSKSQPTIYGLGLPMSISASDTYYLFEQILEAYNVEIINSEGQLQIEEPEVRQGIIQSLNWYTKFYKKNHVPPHAKNWLDPDNNRYLLNRVVMMTPNPTLSIPLAIRADIETYRNQLGISEFPNKPNGEPMRYIVSIRQAVIFADAPNLELAKEFLDYFIQPENISKYLKSAGGRYLPVIQPASEDSFWSNPADPHLSTATQTLKIGQLRPYFSAQNPAYSLVLEKNIWGKAINRIIVDGVSAEQAASEAIEQIQGIFETWE